MPAVKYQRGVKEVFPMRKTQRDISICYSTTNDRADDGLVIRVRHLADAKV